MSGIWRKALADLRSRPLQTALLFAVVATAAATLSLALNVQGSASRPYERLREQTNGADLWIQFIDFRPAGLDALKAAPGVLTVSEPVPISWTNYGIRNGERKQQLALVGMGPQLPAFDHPVVTAGRWIAAGGTRELVLDAGAAQLLRLRVGQQVDLLTPDGPQQFMVVGFAVPTGRAPAPVYDPAFAFVLPETLATLEPGAVFGSSAEHQLRVGVRVAGGPETFDPRNQALRGLGNFGLQFNSDIQANLEEVNQFDVIFLSAFSFFALAASGLIIANTVAGQALAQLRDIGVLKAIGFTPRQVTLALLLQNVTLSLVAALAGVVIGLLFAPFFLQRSAEILGVPANAAFNPVLLIGATIVVVLLVALFTFVPAWRAGRVSVIAALSSGSDSGGGASRIAAAARRLGLPQFVAIGLKDLLRRPARTVMTVAALLLAVVTATFSLGIEATLDKTMSDPTTIGGPPYHLAADRDTFPDAEARHTLTSLPEVESVLPVYLGYSGRIGPEGFSLRGFEGDLNQPRWSVREGRMPGKVGEAAVSTTLARDMGFAVGQRHTIMITSGGQGPGTPLDVQIVGLYVDFDGEVMAVTHDSLPADAEPTDYYIRIREDADGRAVANKIIDASRGNMDPEVLTESIGEVRAQFRSVLTGLNAMLFSIAGVNLLASLLLAIRERRREFAVLKTVGFTPFQIAQSVFVGSTALALIAVVAGLPVGFLVTRFMFDALASAAGIGTGVGEMPGALWLAPLVPGAIVVAALATVIPSRRAAGVKVAEALRYE